MERQTMELVANNEIQPDRKVKDKRALNGFKPGQSGNPSGRPKMSAEEFSLIAACKAKSLAALETIDHLRQHARQESVRLQASLAIWERGNGKPVQPTDNLNRKADAEVAGLPASEAYALMIRGKAG
jgi:hypothetical protein